MIDKGISCNEQVSNLSDRATILYMHAIPHLDDAGLLPTSAKRIKGMLVPLRESISVADIPLLIDELIKQDLCREFEYQNEKFYWFPKFWKYQILKKDRQPQVIMNFKCNKKPKKSWEELSNIFQISIDEFQVEDSDFQVASEVNGSEEKLSEVEEKKRYGEFLNVFLSDSEFQKLTDRFGDKERDNWIEKLSRYLASNRKKKYASHYATILNWAGSDRGSSSSKSKETLQVLNFNKNAVGHKD